MARSSQSSPLTLLRAVETDVADAPEPAASVALTPLTGTGPDGGRRAHPSTAPAGVRSHREVENRIVGLVADLLDAPDDAVGTLATNAFDVALGVVQAARDARPHTRRPTLVLAETAHPAFAAAALALGVVPVLTATDHHGRAAVGATTAAITDETVLVVASAPSHSRAAVDPVAWLAAASSAHGVPLHVDATAGGWDLVHLDRSQREDHVGRVPMPWGFVLPGVTSVGIDVGPDDGTRPAAYAVVFRDADALAARQVDVARLGAGGGTATWAPAPAALADLGETLDEVGPEGCADLALDACAAANLLRDSLVHVAGVHVMGDPAGSVLCLGADGTCDVFGIADELATRGWASEPVLAQRGWPAVLRIRLTAACLPVIEELADAVTDAVCAARAVGRVPLPTAVARTLAVLRAGEVDPAVARRAVEAAAVFDSESRSATVLRLLDAAGPGVREALLAARRDILARPVRAPRPVVD